MSMAIFKSDETWEFAVPRRDGRRGRIVAASRRPARVGVVPEQHRYLSGSWDIDSTGDARPGACS